MDERRRRRRTPEEIKDYVATWGIRVCCTGCRVVYRHVPDRLHRLRFKSSPCCRLRLRPANYPNKGPEQPEELRGGMEDLARV